MQKKERERREKARERTLQQGETRMTGRERGLGKEGGRREGWNDAISD